MYFSSSSAIYGPHDKKLDIDGILDGVVKEKFKAIYLLGADEIDMSKLKNAFVIYQGHHGDIGASNADVVLPGAAYTEKNATYVNTEGRVQHSTLATFPPGDAKEDWAIIRALSDFLNIKLPYNNLHEVRERMSEINSIFRNIGIPKLADWGNFGTNKRVLSDDFNPHIKNYYMTDPIGRSSVTMAKCTNELTSVKLGKIPKNV